MTQGNLIGLRFISGSELVKILKTLKNIEEIDEEFDGASNVFNHYPIYDYMLEDFEMKDVETVLFKVDEINYLAYVDPDDGYRSRSVLLKLPEQMNLITPFPVPIPVTIEVDKEDSYNPYADDEDDDDDSYRQTDRWNIILNYCGKPLLEIGTKNIDDYYPAGVINYNQSILPQHKYDNYET